MSTFAPQESAFGELLTARLIPQAAWRFDYGINTRIVNVTTANGGTVTADGNRAKLTSSAHIAGLARVETLKRLRYSPGEGGLLRITFVHATPKALSKQFFGLGDTADRLYFGYDGLDWGVGRRRSGTDHFVKLESFSGSNPGLDFTKGNVYQIRYQWLGYGYLRFYCLNPDGENLGYSLMHTIAYPNTSPDVHILNPTLPIFAEVQNAGNNTSLVAYTPSAAAFVEGEGGDQGNPLDVFNSYDRTTSFNDTNNNHLLTIRNKSTFLTLANRVPVQVNSITLSRGTGAALTTVRLYRSATTAGALAYTDVDASNSPVDASPTTTTITSVNPERSYSLPAGNLPTIEFRPGEMVLQPGETLSVGVQDSGVQATEITATVNWSELF
jgi:hypothetical protein